MNMSVLADQQEPTENTSGLTQFSMSIVFVHTELTIKTVLFQAVQFSIST